MKLLTRAMVAACAVSMVASTSAKADVPDLGTAGDADVLTALSTATTTITFLHARAEFTNNLVLFTSLQDGSGTVTDGTTYTNPLISVVGNYPNVGIGAPLSTSISVTAGQTLLFGICTSGGATPPAGTAGDVNAACTAQNADYRAWYSGPASNNADLQLHAIIMTAAEWNLAATASGCLAETPPCFLAAAGTTVVGFEDIGGLGDSDWNDLVFSFTNVTTIPEPGTMGLLALGLVGLSGAGLIRRRRSAKRN